MKETKRNLFYTTAEYEDRCLNLLKVVLKRCNIPTEYYNIGGYAEEAICIEKENNEWLLYLGERGSKKFQKKNQDIYLICIDAISELASSDEQEEKMKFLFVKMITAESRAAKRRRITLAMRRNSLLEKNSGICSPKSAVLTKNTVKNNKKSGFQ